MDTLNDVMLDLLIEQDESIHTGYRMENLWLIEAAEKGKDNAIKN